MNDPRVDYLEQQVNLLIARLAATEALLAKLLQRQWQITGTPAGGSAGSAVQIATGSGVAGKSGGVLGSDASYVLKDLDPATGTLSSGPTITVWNDAATAVATGDVIVAKDPNGNYLIITEFC